MSDLTTRRCVPCEGGVEALSPAEIESLLAKLDPGWTLGTGGATIHRSFSFRNYHETMAFVNAVAWVAHREDHHPDLEVGYSRCLATFSTHAVGGLTENDFICAAKVDALL
jgi:4a-hydroxytetrahydrobiopterin dehydratase